MLDGYQAENGRKEVFTKPNSRLLKSVDERNEYELRKYKQNKEKNMLRKRNALIYIAAVTLSLSGVALAKAVKVELVVMDLGSSGGGEAILNYAKGTDKTEIQVNCKGMEPNAEHIVWICDWTDEKSDYIELGTLTTNKKGKGVLHARVKGDISERSVVVLGDDGTNVLLYNEGVQRWIEPVDIFGQPPEICWLVGTDNIINNFSPKGYLCPETDPETHATADVDNDPLTGHWDDDGNWSPNETHIAIIRDRGDLAVDQPYPQTDGRIFFSFIGTCLDETYLPTQRGKFLIKFIDATKPDWDMDDSGTWDARRIDQVRLEVQHDGTRNSVYIGDRLEPNPDARIKIEAWNPYVGVAASFTVGDEAIQQWVPKTIHGGMYGMSELRVYTDFAESMIDDLRLFVCR